MTQTFWDKEVNDPIHVSWMAPLPLRYYINESISGNRGLWPLEWFKSQYPGPYKRALSIGCGTGPLERSLVQIGLCERVDAFDGSIGSLAVAREEASRAGVLDRLRYFAADFNNPVFPPATYDAVFFHQSLHHVGKLEKLFSAVMHTLKPGGLLYLEEFVGPSRHDWSDERVAVYDAIYQQIPRERRLFDHLPPPIQYDDESEAARSSEIVGQLRGGFDVAELRGYGGNVVAVIFPVLVPSRIDDALIDHLIDLDRARVAAGEPPFHVVAVARPKRGLRGALARARYFVVPKLKRVGRELAARVGSRQ